MSHQSSHTPSSSLGSGEESLRIVKECFKHPSFVRGLKAFLTQADRREASRTEHNDSEAQSRRRPSPRRSPERATSQTADRAEGRGDSSRPSHKRAASRPVSVFDRLRGLKRPATAAPTRSAHLPSKGRAAEPSHHPRDDTSEIEVLKKRLSELESKQPPPVHNSEWLNSPEGPLASAILAEPLPKKFKVPQIPAYNGETDPNAHLGHYNSWMDLHGSHDAIRCRMFSLTLGERAQRWYRSLPHHSIQSWAQLTATFRSYFMGSLVRIAPRSSIASIVQGPSESLKDYVSRFNKQILETEPMSDDALAIIAQAGLLKNSFFRWTICQNTPRMYREFLERASSHISAEEAMPAPVIVVPTAPKEAGKKKEAWRDFKDIRKESKASTSAAVIPAARDLREVKPGLMANFTEIFSVGAAAIFEQIKDKNLLPAPRPIYKEQKDMDQTRFCKYHESAGHTTFFKSPSPSSSGRRRLLLLVDSSAILLLPQPPFKPMYYTLVIMDLCKALPGAFPAVVAGAVRSLFDKIADIDMECRTRLILWFSHHLSNFQFIWPWDEWAYVLDLPKWAPQRVFVHEVLEREVRLSYWDKIRQSIETATALEELLPPKGTTNFRYSATDGDQTELGLSSQLTSMVKERVVIREIISWIEDDVLPAHGWDITLRVVVQTLLNIGSKSFTHLITVLERYGQVIAKICPDQDKQVMLICEMSELWKNNAQMTAIAIDRMMGYRLLSNVAIVRWVFTESNVNQFHISDRPWEFLGNAITKTFNRITDLRKEIASLNKSVISAKEAASKALAELEDAKSKPTLALVDGEPVLAENPVKMKRLKSTVDKTLENEVSTRETLEAKEALFARAVEEIEALFIIMYKSFSDVLLEPLRETEGSVHKSGDAEVDEMSIEHEDTPATELDNEGGSLLRSHSNGRGTKNGYNVGEKEQWCISTLGYVKAFTRQYASEIWPLVEKLDAEVLTKDVHPLLRKVMYSGLRRPNDL
ncbi:Nucleic acid dioxygenase ALKBH1 [Orobanche gracilis]